jgi:hypothetical protein
LRKKGREAAAKILTRCLWHNGMMPEEWLAGSILWLKRRNLGLAFLLAVGSWFVLSLVWTHTAPGGLVDRAIGALFSPGFGAGHYLAQALFSDSGAANPTGFYLARLISVTINVLLLTALWFVPIRLVREMRQEQVGEVQRGIFPNDRQP